MKKLCLTIFAVLMLFTTIVFANGKKDSVKNEKPVITFYHGYFQDDWQPAIEMRKIYDDFAKANADKFTFVPVALETGNQGVYDKCVQEISRGKFPDIVDVSGYNIVPAASSADLVIDLKSYIDADPKFKAGIGVNYVQNMKDGKIYTVRDQLETIGFWYNEDLFKKAGAATPDTWKSWADFDAAVDKLIASPAVETPFTMNQGWPTTILISGYLLGTPEGRAFSAKTPATFDTAAFRGALEFLKKSVFDKIDSAHFTAGDSDKYREDFFSGKAAILFNGVWEAGSFGGAGFSIDPKVVKAGMFPTSEPAKKAAIVSASPGYLIAKNQDPAKIEAAIAFVKYMTGAEVADIIFTKAQAMPPSTAIDYSTYINGSNNIAVQKLAEACKAANSASYQNPTAGSVWDQDIANALEGKYAGLKYGTKSIDDVIKELNSLLKK